MKKKKMLVLFAALLASLVRCEPETNDASLWVYNDTGFAITGLYLSGAEDTDNILDGATRVDYHWETGAWTDTEETLPGGVLADQGVASITGLAHGDYTWRVAFDSTTSVMPEYESNEEFTLYPGRNNLVLSMGL